MRPPRLTIASVMALIVFAALGSLAARWFFPPARRPAPPLPGHFAIYESATASDDLAVRVGPNLFEIESVVRNDRDGSLRREDGRGNPARPGPIAEQADLTYSAPWLDAANIRLAGDPRQIGVHNLLFFDHETRIQLGEPRTDLGISQIEPGVFQVRRLGAYLPDRVDVWLWASSLEASAPIHQLPARVGASARLGDRGPTLTIAEIRPGLKMSRRRVAVRPSSLELLRLRYGDRPTLFDPTTRAARTEAEVRDFVRSHTYSRYLIEKTGAALCSILFRRAGDASGNRQDLVIAVTRDGRRLAPLVSEQSLSFMEQEQFLTFPADATEIEQFDVRPASARYTFYFDSVTLPKTSRKPFNPPPMAEVRIDGRTGQFVVNDFSPIRVNLRIQQVAPPSPSFPQKNGSKPAADHNTGITQVSRAGFTAMLEVDGIATRGWKCVVVNSSDEHTPIPANVARIAVDETSHDRANWPGPIPLDRLKALRIGPAQ